VRAAALALALCLARGCGEGEVTPAPAALPPEQPAADESESQREVDARIGKGDSGLPGTLTLPPGPGPFPGLVLVHGSGPHDRDETVGPNKPFRDLANGLASRGVAVLRYDKRSYALPLSLLGVANSITTREEVVDDAAAAATWLRSRPEIDPKRVFLLGHSLGGTLVPRIAARDPDIAGFVILAGSARAMEDVIVEQLTYIASLDGEVSDEEAHRLDDMKAQVARVKDPALSADTPAQGLPFGVPASYWLDLRGYDPPQAARDVPRPMLVLQGERDYQVTLVDDFRLWREALESRTDVRFKSYPALNHLFMEGTGKAVPAEYGIPGHVSETVIDDIAAWLQQGR